ncbi:hypothetical protein RN001_009876 [Aquatica leii]|uniref:THAP-type domain-containing protein n=1 Tax=Aquatica leii TaxID=1421715 RepID=A0AAN7Q2T6_9COLE|nr:hypothetical protein RN001_009876 [Aquatica leii]
MPPMVFVCCIPNCSRTTKNTSIHRFPKDEEVYQKWLSVIQRSDLISMDAQQVRNSYRVCDVHFASESKVDPSYFSQSHLIQGAVPTLLLPATAPTADTESWLPASAADTADFLLFVDKLFDSKNGTVIKPVAGKNAFKLNGSNKFVSEDYDKETQDQRKKMLLVQPKLKESAQECRPTRNGLLINGKFKHISEIINCEGIFDMKEKEVDHNHIIEQNNVKKRRRTAKMGNTSGSADIMDFFRSRSDSASSTKSIFK